MRDQQIENEVVEEVRPEEICFALLELVSMGEH